MDQSARMASLDAFKNGAVDILVCSDVAARGLDIPDVSHVVNFDVPTHSEDYVHRIGRTGRAGRSGVSLTIVTGDDGKYVAQIEDLIKRKIDWLGPKVEELGEPQYTARDRERTSRGERSGASSRRGGRAPSAGRGPRPERAAPVERAERAQPVERAEHAQPVERASRRRSAERAERPLPVERPQAVEAEARTPRAKTRDHEARVERDFSREHQRPRRGGQKVDNDPPVIGLGDHVPSFLLRPVRIKGAKPVE
jgi:superfamily II DNA/RNA helicase